MKKISLVVLAVCAGAAMNAQNYEKPTPMKQETRFGIKAGVNMAEYKIEDNTSTTSVATQNKAGFNGGFFANIPLSSAFRVQPELSYSMQGSKLTATAPAMPSGTTTYTYDAKLGYINLPVLFQYQTTSGFYLETGPQAGYLLTAKNVGTGSNNTGETDVRNQMKKFDFAWAGGIGYLSRVGLGVDARYNYGFRTLYDDNTTGSMQGKVKNRVMQFDLFWQFGAGK